MEESRKELINDLADIVDKLNNRQIASIKRIVANTKEKQYIPLNQITIDEYLRSENLSEIN